MAVAAVEAGAPIRKFGQIIGFASRPVSAGEWVHEHNCGVKEFARDYHFGEDARAETIVAVESQPTFQGLRRANGKVGTRNYLAVPDIGELLRDRCAAHRQGGRTLGHSTTIRTSTA